MMSGQVFYLNIFLSQNQDNIIYLNKINYEREY